MRLVIERLQELLSAFVGAGWRNGHDVRGRSSSPAIASLVRQDSLAVHHAAQVQRLREIREMHQHVVLGLQDSADSRKGTLLDRRRRRTPAHDVALPSAMCGSG
jgi:hypothetical protein